MASSKLSMPRSLVVLVVSSTLFAVHVVAGCGREARAEPRREATDANDSPRPTARSPVVRIASTTRRTATLAAVGDVLPHKMTKRSALRRAARAVDGSDVNNEGYDAIFGSLHGLLDRYDVATYNMETPVTREDYLPPAFKRFRAVPGMPRALRAAGFDVAVCANNHALDQGRDGLRESIANLRDAGLLPVGCGASFAEASAPVIVEANGIRIGIVAFARISNAYNPLDRDRPGIPQVLFWYAFDDEGREVLDAVRALRARRDVDVVVVNAHWDREYASYPLASTRAIARAVVDAGADLVIGHHPHVLQPAEWTTASDGRRAAVVYSLGNFLSDMCATLSPHSTCDRRLSAMAVATFGKGADGRGSLDDLAIVPAWTAHGSHCPGEPEPSFHCVRPVLVPNELEALRARATSSLGAPPASLLASIEGYETRDAMIRAFMGPHPSGASPRTPYVGAFRNRP